MIERVREEELLLPGFPSHPCFVLSLVQHLPDRQFEVVFPHINNTDRAILGWGRAWVWRGNKCLSWVLRTGRPCWGGFGRTKGGRGSFLLHGLDERWAGLSFGDWVVRFGVGNFSVDRYDILVGEIHLVTVTVFLVLGILLPA